MSRSHWRVVLAVVGGLILLGSGYGYYRFQEAAKDPYTAERYQPARDARLPQPMAKQEVQSRPYEPNCEQPQSHADADLCAQWGSVKAVSETNRLTRLALNLAALGFLFAVIGSFVGVVGTYYLIQAFHQARRSADAARDANRPWLRGAMRAEAIPFIEGNKITFALAIELKNVGGSPAILKEGIDAAACVCVYPLNPLWARDAALKKIDRHFYGGLPKRGKTIFPGGEYNYVLSVEEEIGPAIVPKGLELAQPDEWPFTENDLVAFIAIGVWYDFAGGEGRTEFVYQVVPGREVSIKRVDGDVFPTAMRRMSEADTAL